MFKYFKVFMRCDLRESRVLSWFHRMKMEPKPQKEVSQGKNPTPDEDDNTVTQKRIPTTKKEKGKPESRCSFWIGTASHQRSRMRYGSDDMESTRSSMERKSESFCEIRYEFIYNK